MTPPSVPPGGGDPLEAFGEIVETGRLFWDEEWGEYRAPQGRDVFETQDGFVGVVHASKKLPGQGAPPARVGRVYGLVWTGVLRWVHPMDLRRKIGVAPIDFSSADRTPRRERRALPSRVLAVPILTPREVRRLGGVGAQPTDVVFLAPPCHASAPVFASIAKDTMILHVVCAVCRRPVANLALSFDVVDPACLE